MMKDRYGNYVIQKCIEVSHGKQREVLVKKITACANVLRKQANYSRHVYNFIEKMSDGGSGAPMHLEPLESPNFSPGLNSGYAQIMGSMGASQMQQSFSQGMGGYQPNHPAGVGQQSYN